MSSMLYTMVKIIYKNARAEGLVRKSVLMALANEE